MEVTLMVSIAFHSLENSIIELLLDYRLVGATEKQSS